MNRKYIDFTKVVSNLETVEGIGESYDKLFRIRGIKHKVASFLLRDLVSFDENNKYANSVCEREKEVYPYLQPLDTWLIFIADQLGLKGSTNLSNTYIERLRERKLRLINDHKVYAICEACIEAGVNPIKFNQGAWYVGSSIVRCKEQLRDILREDNDFKRAKLIIEAGLNKDIFEKGDGPYWARDIQKDACLRNVLEKELDELNKLNNSCKG